MRLTVNSLPERHIEQAQMLFVVRTADGTAHLVAREAATREFVTVPASPAPPPDWPGASWNAQPVALSRDGTGCYSASQKSPRDR
jgi:hypothetical protein